MKQGLGLRRTASSVKLIQGTRDYHKTQIYGIIYDCIWLFALGSLLPNTVIPVPTREVGTKIMLNLP